MASGEIGVISRDGEQIGGFTDWEISVRIEQHLPLTRVRLSAWWLFNPLPAVSCDLAFYRRRGDSLMLVNRQRARLPVEASAPLDTLVNTPLEFRPDEPSDNP